jgi:hypothetical protein
METHHYYDKIYWDVLQLKKDNKRLVEDLIIETNVRRAGDSELQALTRANHKLKIILVISSISSWVIWILLFAWDHIIRHM